MKRSEMLSKIASVIINYNEVDSVIKREKALEIAETILQIQEEAGMLPPSYQLRIKNTGIGGAVAATRIDGKWEPENETQQND